MNFHRLAVSPIEPDLLRKVGADGGWLLENDEVLRVGLGRAVQSISVTASDLSPEVQLAGHVITGDVGPTDSGVVAFGALPFNPSASGQLSVPEVLVTQYSNGTTYVTTVEDSEGLIPILERYVEVDQEPQSVRSLHYEPTPEEYAHKVAAAVEHLRKNQVQKVVLARAVKGSVPEPINAGALAMRLRKREPRCTLYSMPLLANRRFLGVSPELLIERRGTVVRCNPLAGTIALPLNTPSEDYQNWLLGSAKNLNEHKLLVDEMVSVLKGLFTDVTADEQPSILKLRTVAHLSSWLSASGSAESMPPVMQILRLLHPTAAVCGIPREAALQLLTDLEGQDRGSYAGPVGWIDSSGDGEWWLGIRGVVLSGNNFEAWSGAGIVSESDPIAEREETKDKLASVLTSIAIT
jgi:isochorismate synthase